MQKSIAAGIAWGTVLLGGLCTLAPAVAQNTDLLAWHGDYREAMNMARQERKLLLVYFRRDPGENGPDDFERQVLAQEEIRPLLSQYVLVRLPLAAEISVSGKPVKLLEHGAFAELHQRPGLAVVDLANVDSKHYGYVVSVYPFRDGRYLGRRHFVEFANLPAGSLTQRTLILAVRTHSERPQSAQGKFEPLLAGESERHSVHQASINTQGHHDWDQRFHRINAKLPEGMVAQEVCAESWPGQGLVEAAEECVHSWRQSGGHWSTVRARQPLFGYDMKRGRDGVWYATGIFARR